MDSIGNFLGFAQSLRVTVARIWGNAYLGIQLPAQFPLASLSPFASRLGFFLGPPVMRSCPHWPSPVRPLPGSFKVFQCPSYGLLGPPDPSLWRRLLSALYFPSEDPRLGCSGSV